MTSGSNPHASANPGLSFCLRSPAEAFSARGLRRALPAGPLDTLAQRAAGFFLHETEGSDRLVGAIPFDRTGDDSLYQPESLHAEIFGPAAASEASVSFAPRSVRGEPSAGDYAAAVGRCLRRIADESALRKVVLSRSLVVRGERGVDARSLLRQLGGDRSVTAFQVSLPPLSHGERSLVGASPELLVSRRGRQVASHPLAGSARRRGNPALDRQAGEALERSEKDNREHRATVEAVFEALSPFCDELAAPEGTRLCATATMWHLGTRVEGRLRDAETPVAALLAALHPTPAVCGLPRARASELIAAEEGYDRGFYAGAVGWMDRAGDGEWYVSLRCAEIAGADIRLYAGAGIVEGSDPAAETAETSAKFVAMLSALGIDETGRVLKEFAA